MFGWASTNPIYGGTGSGAVDVATAVDILGGLKNAGFTVNQELMGLVTSNFDNVIVVYNGANSMEMGWTEDYEQIKGVLLCAGPGSTGFNALGKIISGKVNPSGKTVDLWASDLLQPGDSASVELTIDLEDLASYDTGIKVNGGGYILEAGEYVISLRSDSPTVLDETTVDVASDVIYNENNPHNGDQTAAAPSVGKIRTLDTDGPAGMCSPTLGMYGTGYCCNMIISQSWNRQLAYDAAKGIAQEFYDFGVVGWYAPSMNIRRSAFAGRNFEYYSEDGYLSGELARQQVQACENTGVYPYIKHFALNDQETNRNGMLCTWTTEQAMRQACKDVFFTTVNSAVYENYSPDAIPGWLMTAYLIEGAAAAVLVIAEILLVRGYMKKKSK